MIVAFIAFILIGATDGATGVVLPSIEAQYGIGKQAVSLLFLAITAGYVVAAFASGLLVATLGRRWFLMLGAAAFALGALCIGVRPLFVVVLATAMVLGFGFAIIDAGLNTYITELPHSTTPLNTLHACYGAGGFLGPIIASGLLAARLPWNGVYLLWTACSLALLMGFGLVFDAGRGGGSTRAASAASGNLLTGAFRHGIVWIAAAFMLVYVGTEVTLGGWSFSFLTEVRHHATLFAGWAVSGYWLGITVGRLTLARLAARIRVPDRRLIAYCLIGAGAGVLCVWVAPTPIVAASGLWLTGFSLGPIYPTTIALLPGLVPARLVASAVGFLAGLGSAGAAFFPWLAGNLAHAVGLASLMPYTIGLIAAMSALWLVLTIRLGRAEQEATDSLDSGHLVY